MVFGTTYCAISHLPINDGDRCILVPLGFNMKQTFNIYNKADINSFMYLYNFLDEMIEVTYEGNPDMIKYDEDRKLYQLYMLLNKKFYYNLIEQYKNPRFDTTQHLPLFKTVSDVWHKANEFQLEQRMSNKVKFDNEELTRDEVVHLTMNTPTPEWIKNIYIVASFMDKLGMIPYPNNAVDQQLEILPLYNKLVEESK